MQAALTLAPDLAARVSEMLDRNKGRSLEQLLQLALKLGLEQLEAGREAEVPRGSERFETPTFSAGVCALESLDDVGAVLTFVDGDRHR